MLRASFRTRLRLFSIGLIIFALLLVIRLYFVQVVHGGDFALKAERQYASASSLFDRGSIFFTRRDGTLLSAAGLETGFRIAIAPNQLKDPQAIFALISSSTPVDADAFFKSAAKTDDPYEVVAEHVPEAAGQAIADADAAGIMVERERWRLYPADAAGAQTVGFIGYDDNNTITGRTGLERYYEDVLARGSDGLFGNFFAELFANVGDAAGDPRSAHAGDLVTTIEPLVENKLHAVLLATNAQYRSLETGGIIMDPATGAIIALDTVPSFDPNDLSESDPDHFGNPLVEHRYEFGSIMKSLTMASGLDAGVITPSSTYNDTGCITLNTKKICNYDLRARGPDTPMQQILSQSLNVGASFIAGKLGHERMRSYFEKLGFGTETGIDLPSEIAGDIHNIESSPRDVEYATASFGQGIAETPVEMIRALGALANHGAIVTPHVVKSIRLESGVTKDLSWGEPEQVFSAGAVDEDTRMLVHVVDTALANGKDKIPEMSIAAKTGTAQIAGPGGAYYANKYFHSFFGYFPAYNAKFIILLYTREPQGVQYASETLTEPFFELTHFLESYYEIPPDRQNSEER